MVKTNSLSVNQYRRHWGGMHFSQITNVAALKSEVYAIGVGDGQSWSTIEITVRNQLCMYLGFT